MSITIAYNAVNARILNAPPGVLNEVNRLLSYKSEGAEHTAAFADGWDGTGSFFSFPKQAFPAGFVSHVARGVEAFTGERVQVLSKAVPQPLGAYPPVVDDFGFSDRYEYQLDAVEQLVRHHAITVQVATGGGKSRIARMALKRIGRKALFLTTRGVLAYQMLESLEEMTGAPVAMLGDSQWGIKGTKSEFSEFSVGMVQTLASVLTKMTVPGEVAAFNERRKKKLGKLVEKDIEVLKKAGVNGIRLRNERMRLATLHDDVLPTVEGEMDKIKKKVAAHEAKRAAAIDFLSQIEFVIVEEAHEVSSDSFYVVMAHLVNARYRMALTATPFMRNEQANLRLLGSCGPIAVRISEKFLIDKGILARPYFKFIRIPPHLKHRLLMRFTPWQKAYQYGVVEAEARNQAIVYEAAQAKAYGLNSMVLVLHKAHGEALKQMMLAVGIRAEFIFGEDDQPARKRALKALGSGEIDCLIGSTIMDVGVDVPSIGMVILAGGGMAEVATRQRIGRGLREKKGGLPNVAFIVDFYDADNEHLLKHSLTRISYVKDTPGFAEGIVPFFDYEALGFKKAA